MTNKRIIAYLLEELPEEEMERFEEECFQQDSWPEQISLVEEELIDDYLLDELEPKQRLRFERNYLTTPARQERVGIAAALLRHFEGCREAPEIIVEPTKRTWLERLRAFWSNHTWALPAAFAMTLMIAMVGTWWLIRPRTPQTFATLTLTAERNTRAEGVQPGKVTFPINADALKIILKLTDTATAAVRYRVELKNQSGERRPLLVTGQDAQSVLVVIPAEELPRGLYVLHLFVIKADGTEQSGSDDYYFSVQ